LPAISRSKAWRGVGGGGVGEGGVVEGGVEVMNEVYGTS
jgi:hypothetical protein